MGKLYITRAGENVPELFQPLLRYHARGSVCFQSSPFTSIANSSARIVSKHHMNPTIPATECGT